METSPEGEFSQLRSWGKGQESQDWSRWQAKSCYGQSCSSESQGSWYINSQWLKEVRSGRGERLLYYPSHLPPFPGWAKQAHKSFQIDGLQLARPMEMPTFDFPSTFDPLPLRPPASFSYSLNVDSVSMFPVNLTLIGPTSRAVHVKLLSSL